MTEKELYISYKGVRISSQLCTEESLAYYEDFCFRPDDFLIVTYPKSGTTWMQEIVPLIQQEGDPASVQSQPNWERAPWLEYVQAPSLNLEQRPSPRFFTTHYPYSMMPPSFFKARPKVIYVMRNPKDVLTSLFHFNRMCCFEPDPESMKQFVQKFLDGKETYGSWFDHVKGWLDAEEKERIFYISYEEMIMDLNSAVTRISQFMEKSLGPEVIEKIVGQSRFTSMKKNNMSNYSLVPKGIFDFDKSEFLRKGVTGDWKNHLTVAESELFDSVYKDKMQNVTYQFVWD
ncbi:unnamed protein product [Merluccius merluccius]